MIRLLLLAWAALFFMVGPVRAESPKVTPSLVCQVQTSLRHLAPRWTPARCAEVARAFADTPTPATLMAMCILESDMVVTAYHRRGDVIDAGLCGVACRVGKGGRCTNWPVRGATLGQLLDARVNIAAASRILERKRSQTSSEAAALMAYNGGTKPGNRYSANVSALIAALGGRTVESASRRVRELVRRIVLAVRSERKS